MQEVAKAGQNALMQDFNVKPCRSIDRAATHLTSHLTNGEPTTKRAQALGYTSIYGNVLGSKYPYTMKAGTCSAEYEVCLVVCRLIPLSLSFYSAFVYAVLYSSLSILCL